ncbi:MAG TPA: carboxypeptidase regulatory-like domain-containing protein [Candidatus Solibacter sp.]|nr:carboxypeptidase regulatory-like domain-containing protein [Candidatus Solibacter sp.]
MRHLFLLFFSALGLAAQATSTIEGTVKDKQGLAIAGAQVHVSSAVLAVDLSATSGSDGASRITSLAPSVYQIKATKDDKTQDRSTYEHADVPPDGIDYVLVNGELVIDHGKHTGARPGRIIYGPGYQK